VNGLAWVASSVVLPLVVAEVTELGPWLARQVIKLGARLVVPRTRAARLEEEWLAGVEDWPGKLTKLVRAVWLVLLAVPKINYDYFDLWWQRHIGAPVGIRAMSASLRISLHASWPVRVCVEPQERRHLKEFNQVLAIVFRMVRSPDATHRAAALELIEALIKDPPWWVRDLPSPYQALHRHEFARLAECVQLRHV
jgi:hypothetical protein